MPSQPAWFHRLEEILALLRGFDTRYLDRQAGQEAVERCFDLGHRQWDQLGAGTPHSVAINIASFSKSR